MDDSQEMTTPLDRFFTFWWILAGFAVFGLLALLAYLFGGKQEDTAYKASMETRLATKTEVDVAQAKALSEVKIDLAKASAALSSAKPAVSQIAVPGSPTHKKLMDEMAAKQKVIDDAKAAADAANRPEGSAPAVQLTLTATNATAGQPPLQYVEKELTAPAGSPIVLTFKNPDVQMHNVVICKPGKGDAVGALAMAMAADPEAMAKGYIPTSDDVLANSKLLMPGQSGKVEFTIAEPGDYPYVCTFPGHTALMKGVLKITPAK